MSTINQQRTPQASGRKLVQAAHRALHQDQLSREHSAILAEVEAEIDKAVRRLERILNK